MKSQALQPGFLLFVRFAIQSSRISRPEIKEFMRVGKEGLFYEAKDESAGIEAADTRPTIHFKGKPVINTLRERRSVFESLEGINVVTQMLGISSPDSRFPCVQVNVTEPQEDRGNALVFRGTIHTLGDVAAFQFINGDKKGFTNFKMGQKVEIICSKPDNNPKANIDITMILLSK